MDREAPRPVHLQRPFRLIASSTVASAADVATLLCLVALGHLAQGPATVLGCLVGGGVNFLLSRAWVFEDRGGSPLRQAALYALFAVLGGALLSGGIVHVATQLGAPVLAAKGVAAALVLGAWNYPVSTLLVFRKEPVS